MNTPIEKFKNDKEFQKVAHEWQKRLFLDSWFIKYSLSDEPLYANPDDKEECFGVCDKSFETNEAFITINTRLHTKVNESNLVCKNCCFRAYEELTLVHELLHCVLFPVYSLDTYSEKFMDIHNHAKVEQLAKSFIMTKYNLDKSFFLK